MKWANFFHVYQPPTQKDIWVTRIAEESYRKLFLGLKKIPRANVTLNINAVLCDLLIKNDCADVVEMIKDLIISGNVEITGSAKYHAFLPLLPDNEIERQILLNEEGLNKYFGNDWKKGGFFSPEMAYSINVARVAKKLGYKYIIIDEMAFPGGNKPKRDVKYKIDGIEDFYVFFRERNFSFKILSASEISTVGTILRFLENRFDEKGCTITGMDGETFGHHRPGLENVLFSLLENPNIDPISLSEIFKLDLPVENVTPRSSTWASLPRDFLIDRPFSRWNNPENIIQIYQWELTNLAIEIVRRSDVNKNKEELDSALHSDQYWWSSARPWWSLEMIERGAFDLKDIILNSVNATSEEKKIADDLYKKIIYTGFEWQRNGIVDELSRQENEEVREKLEEKEKLYVTEEEFSEMLNNMREQMLNAAKSEEYHRAAMLKDRIREVTEEMKSNKKIEPKQGADLMF